MGKRISYADVADEAPLDLNEFTHPEPAPDVPNELPVAELAANPSNPRPPLDDDPEITELADTVRAGGVLQPLVVVSIDAYRAAKQKGVNGVYTEPPGGASWVVVIGNRRLAAAKAAGLERVPVVIDDARAARADLDVLVENGARRALDPILEAKQMRAVLDGRDMSQRALAEQVGRTPMYVSQRLALTKLISELADAVTAGQLRIERARQLAELDVNEQRACWEAGPPQWAPASGRGVGSRRIQASSPAVAAASLRKHFSAAELAELVQLLS